MWLAFAFGGNLSKGTVVVQMGETASTDYFTFDKGNSSTLHEVRESREMRASGRSVSRCSMLKKSHASLHEQFCAPQVGQFQEVQCSRHLTGFYTSNCC